MKETNNTHIALGLIVAIIMIVSIISNVRFCNRNKLQNALEMKEDSIRCRNLFVQEAMLNQLESLSSKIDSIDAILHELIQKVDTCSSGIDVKFIPPKQVK